LTVPLPGASEFTGATDDVTGATGEFTGATDDITGDKDIVVGEVRVVAEVAEPVEPIGVLRPVLKAPVVDVSKCDEQALSIKMRNPYVHLFICTPCA
jgi:hypothetical protein